MFDETILPSNATHLEKTLEVAFAPDIDVTPVGHLISPDDCPAHLLGWLAWALSVDSWNPNWTDLEKRRVCKNSLWVHQRKGTLGSIKRALAAAGYGDAQIEEGISTFVGSDWIVGDDQGVGGLSHWAEYRVTIQQMVTPDEVANINKILLETAPAHCRLRHVSVENVNIAVGGAWAVGDASAPVGATFRVEG